MCGIKKNDIQAFRKYIAFCDCKNDKRARTSQPYAVESFKFYYRKIKKS
jgi:hypothetical protein